MRLVLVVHFLRVALPAGCRALFAAAVWQELLWTFLWVHFGGYDSNRDQIASYLRNLTCFGFGLWDGAGQRTANDGRLVHSPQCIHR